MLHTSLNDETYNEPTESNNKDYPDDVTNQVTTSILTEYLLSETQNWPVGRLQT